MRDVLIMIITIINSVLVPTIGIFGYYLDIRWLLTISILCLSWTTITKYFNTVTLVCHSISITIGIIIAIIFHLNIFATASVSVCYEWIVTSLFGHISILISVFKSQEK